MSSKLLDKGVWSSEQRWYVIEQEKNSALKMVLEQLGIYYGQEVWWMNFDPYLTS